jgi:phage terminase large subunit
MTKVTIKRKYKQFFDNEKKRYVIITGGRGSGKSFATATYVCRMVNNYPNWRILYTRYTLTSAEISVIPEFEEKLDLLGVRPLFDVTKKEIKNKVTESDIIFSGIKTSSGNQTAKLKSIPGLNAFIVEEAEEFEDEQAFDVINYSIRAKGVQNIVIIVMNPPTIEHWIWRRFFEKSHRMAEIDGVQIPISTHPDVLHIHTTYLDNKENLHPDFLAEIETVKKLNRQKYEHIFLGKWRDKAEGVIFENWIEGEFDTTLPYCYGLDFGFTSPLALVKVAVDSKRRLIFIDEYLYKSYLPAQNVIHLMGCIDRPYDLIIADSAEPTLIAGIAQDGYNVTNAKKREIIEDIRLIQEFTIVATEKSYNVKRELRNYTWNDKKSETPKDEYNHALDAMRYAFNRLHTPSTVLATN